MLWGSLNYVKNEFKIVLLTSFIISLIYCLFSFGLPERFNSPDEAANAFFAKRLAQGLSMAAPITDSVLQNINIIHPRSVGVINNNLIPAGFIGLSLIIGLLGYVFGIWLLPLVTPLLGMIGLVSFFYLIKKYLGTKEAWLGLILLATLPSYWYYHSRSFYHNALFFDLVLLGICLFAYLDKTKKWWQYGVIGLILGGALTIRTSEIFWLTTAAALWWWLRRQELNNKFVVYLVGGVVVGFLPTILTNLYLYGHPFSIGYKSGLIFPSDDLLANTWLVKQLILPFGVNLKNIWQASLKYLVILMPWWSVLAVVGWFKIIFDWQKLPSNLRQIIWPILLASVWLVVLYGSWYFVDSPNPSDITLGTSYARYWLPIYALSLLPILYFFKWLMSLRVGKYIVVFLIGIYVVCSVYLVWWQPLEGLAVIRGNVIRFEQISLAIQKNTEFDSVIVAERTDKMFWPARQVIFALANDSDFTAVKNIIQSGKKVYKFQPTLSVKELGDLNKVWLGQYYLQLLPVGHGWSGYSLYQILRGDI